MNWGNSLLSFLFDADSVNEFFYNISQIVFDLLLKIWNLLAGIVVAVENIFRKIAGLGTGENSDMVSEIINHHSVQSIFGNLVSLATAVIIFFTIIKIIQEHYKEKDGGNPYKIILRTFKGLLMFFFVQGAVFIGLRASQAMFRALDAATGGGSNVTIAGKVFKSMVADANRMRLGAPSESGVFYPALNRYYQRMASSSVNTKDGKYVMVEMTGDNSTLSTSSTSTTEKILAAFPEYKYGVVNADGTVTPFVNWMKTSGLSTTAMEDKDGDDFWEEKYWTGGVQKPEFDGDLSDGTSSGFVGYRNDLFRGFSTNVRPSISLTWSPVDIYEYNYSLKATPDPITDVKTISVFGNATTITMTTTFVKYMLEGVTPKSLEESAKMFGISLNGQVSLQGDQACASFSLDTFNPEKFLQIFSGVLLNTAYTKLTQQIIEAIPKVPGSFTISGFTINFMQLISPIVLKTFEKLNELLMGKLIPLDEHGNPVVQSFVINPQEVSSGIWVAVNGRSNDLPVTIQNYKIDLNFRDLWGQLLDDFGAILKQIQESGQIAWEEAEQMNSELKNLAKKTQEQAKWQVYKSVLDEYNEGAIDKLNRLAQYCYLYDSLLYGTNGAPTFDVVSYELNRDEDATVANEWLESQGFNYSLDQLLDSFRSTFYNLVSGYNKLNPLYSDLMPMNSYADVVLTKPLYQPLIEFNMTNETAASFSIPQIIDALMNVRSNTGKINLNLKVEEDGGRYDAYRLVDWASYGPRYNNEFGAYIDLYHDRGYVPIPQDKPTEYFYDNNQNRPEINSVGKKSLVFADVSNWSYFFDPQHFGNTSKFPNNPFIKTFNPTHGLSNKPMHFCTDGHWGARGITIGNGDLIDENGNILSNRYYQEYQGTSMVLVSTDNMWSPTNTWLEQQENNQTSTVSVDAVDDQASVRSSSATSNETLANAKTEFDKDLAVLNAGIDTSSPLANEFAKKIITLRKMTPANDDEEEKPDLGANDVKILEDWIEQRPTMVLLNPHKSKEVYNMTADEIDDLMVDNSGRRYLVLTADGTVTADDKNFASYKGRFSFQDEDVVTEFYYGSKINYAIGYIGIVTALGVYLNFAFGLIQRAVNMAVLYIMSPVTIAFYPFDDGQKFNQNFVSQFYKEAISAFSIIISLNVFIVLMTPVQTAFDTVVGNSFLSWIALVAFTSMLPKIRDSITSILGANSIQSKSIGKMLDEAREARHAPSAALKNNAIGRKMEGIGKGLSMARAAGNYLMAGAKDRKEKKIKAYDDFEKNGGKLNGFQKWRRDRLKGVKRARKRDEQKERIDKALAQGLDVDANNSGLTKKNDIKRYNNIRKAAEMQAKKEIESDQSLRGLSAAEKEAKIKARQADLMKDEGFTKSVNSVVSAKKGLKNRDKQIEKGVKAERKEVEAAEKAEKAKRSQMRLVGSAISNSAAGELFKWTFDQSANGLLKNSKSKLLAPFRAVQSLVDVVGNDDAQKKYSKNAVDYQKKKSDINSTLLSAAQVDANKINEAVDGMDKDAKTFAIDEQLKNSNMSFEERYKALYLAARAQSYMDADGMDVTRAKEKANEDFNKLEKPDDYEKAYNDLTFDGKKGDEALVAGIASGSEAFSGIIEQDSSVFEKIAKKISQKSEMSEKDINVEITNLDKLEASAVADMVAKVSAILGINKKDNKEEYENLEKIFKSGSSQEGVFAAISETFKGNDKIDDVKKSLDTSFGGFASEMAKFNDELRILNSAKEARKLFDKGGSMIRSKLGDAVPAEEIDKLVSVMRNKQDSNLNSANTNSLGYAINEVIKKHEAEGGKAYDEECVQKIDAVKKRFTDAVTEQFSYITENYGKEIREFNTSKKHFEEMNATKTTALLTEYQNQREYHINMNMDVPAIQAVVNDGLIQQLHDKGDYVTAGLKLQELVDAVRAHDMNKINSLGFDKETVDKLMTWQRRGNKDDLKNLEGIRGLGVFDASNFGTFMEDMSGDSFAGMETTFARITTIAERKMINEKLEIAIRAHQADESEARRTIKAAIDKMESTFNNSAFEKLLGDDELKLSFTDLEGNAIGTDTKKLAETLKTMATKYELGEIIPNSKMEECFKNNFEQLQKARGKAMADDNQSMVNALNVFLDDAYNMSNTANEKAGLVDIIRNQQSSNNAKMHEDYKKLTGGSLKPAGGGAQ